MNDIKHACERCHELLTPDGTGWHVCGRTPEGTLPAHQPHVASLPDLFADDAELDAFLRVIRED